MRIPNKLKKHKNKTLYIIFILGLAYAADQKLAGEYLLIMLIIVIATNWKYIRKAVKETQAMIDHEIKK